MTIMPFDLLSWNCAFYTVIAVILLLPFLYDGGRTVLTYHGKFFIYYSVLLLSSFGFIWVFLFNIKNVKNFWYAADVLKHLTIVLGIKWELRDMKNLEADGGIIIANHQSSLDLMGMFQFWRLMGKCTAVAKKELFYFWPFGLCAWLGGLIYIDRTCPLQAYERLQKEANLSTRNKTKLFFFPEGTRNMEVNKTKKLLPFKKGAFKVAIMYKLPILPVVYSPYYFVDPEERYFGQGRVIVKALPPIPTTDLTENDTEDLMKRASDLMSKAFDELFEEVVSTLPENHQMRELVSK